jgi:HK97 family phage major capsid protein
VAIEQTSRARGEKAFAAPTGSIPLPALSTVPVSMGMLGAPLVQAIGLRPWPADGGRAVTYLRQTGRVNRAAIWHSGAAADGSDTPSKPISDLTSVAVVANAETIAHLASPVKRNDLADFSGMAQWVQTELTYGLTQALEAAVLTAAGPEPAMTGLLHLAGTTPVANAGDVAGTIEAAAVALQLLGYGDGLQAAINPADWSGVATAKGTDGHYLYPTLPTGPAAPSLFGVGIIPSPNVPAGTAVVSNFRQSTAIYEREVPLVTWGTINDEFSKNLLSALCEGRYALTVPQPAAVAIADLTP